MSETEELVPSDRVPRKPELIREIQMILQYAPWLIAELRTAGGRQDGATLARAADTLEKDLVRLEKAYSELGQ